MSDLGNSTVKNSKKNDCLPGVISNSELIQILETLLKNALH